MHTVRAYKMIFARVVLSLAHLRSFAVDTHSYINCKLRSARCLLRQWP